MAKPMKTLELHYPMIQFLIIRDIYHVADVRARWYSYRGRYHLNKIVLVLIALPTAKHGRKVDNVDEQNTKKKTLPVAIEVTTKQLKLKNV